MSKTNNSPKLDDFIGEAEFRNQASDRLAKIGKMVEAAGVKVWEATYHIGQSLAQSQRMGKPEDIERSESSVIGLRLLNGQRQATVRGNDYSTQGMAEMVNRAVAMAKVIPEDPWLGLADAADLADMTKLPDCDSVDENMPSDELLRQRAAEAEEAALAVAGITNSEGASASWSFSRGAVMASQGFFAVRSASRHSLSVQAIAGEGLAMEGDYDYSSQVYGSDLKSAQKIGVEAATRALARLNPKKPPSGSYPIIFDRRVAPQLLGALAGAISGSAVAKRTSFLQDKLGAQIFPTAITIIDDPHRRRGLGSRAFDAEGLATQKQALVDQGRLTNWILDLASARQLGMKSNAMAGRNGAGLPQASTSNLYLAAGKLSRQELFAEAASAFIVTHLMGMGVNQVTGDFSQGVGGFWVEHGHIIHPVNEATIAGNLLFMFANMTAANDLIFDHAVDSPSLRIDGMTLA